MIKFDILFKIKIFTGLIHHTISFWRIIEENSHYYRHTTGSHQDGAGHHRIEEAFGTLQDTGLFNRPT